MRTAASTADSIRVRAFSSASAQRTETDLSAEKVRSLRALRFGLPAVRVSLEEAVWMEPVVEATEVGFADLFAVREVE